MAKKKKVFVLDTNVLLHDASSLFKFDDNHVVIPMTVLEELDGFKDGNKEIHSNARHVSRELDNLRGQGKLLKGVKTKRGGTIRIENNCQKIPKGFYLDTSIPDHRILLTAFNLKIDEKNKEKDSRKENERKNDKKPVKIYRAKEVILVTKDINLRLKAEAYEVEVQDYNSDKVNITNLNINLRECIVSSEQVDAVFKGEKVDLGLIDLRPNNFLFLKSKTNPTHTCIARNDNSGLRVVNGKKVWNVTGKNKEQKMALDILMEPSIELVTLAGKAGTGKTLLALAAGLENVIRLNRYDKVVVYRPIVALGDNDLGYMPGDKDEKLGHWMVPVNDSLMYLLEDFSGLGNEFKKMPINERINALFKTGKLQLDALAHLRGRTLVRQYVIIDEAQNLTPHEAKTIITRAGNGTKMVLTGDPHQIDNYYLDSSSNGLIYAAETMKNRAIHAHATLQVPERSNLASIAAECM